MSFHHHPHEIYDANMQQQQQQQRVKVVAGYALQQRLGSGSFATVYKGIKISAAAPTEQQQQQQQQQQQRESSSSSMCDDDENDTTTTATTDVAEDNHQQQQQQQDDDEKPAEVAIKAISRTSEKLTKKVLQNLEIEISILRTYRHPNIVCMHDVTKTQQHFYLILEYCDGGDVQHLIRSRKSGRLSEKLARRLMRDLSSGLRFLWRQQLIHRDIKPQNLLLTGRLPMEEIIDNPPSAATIQKDQNNPPNNNNNNYGFSLKIADFGFARHLQTASLAETLCGSPLYMAPEILQHHRYDAKADLWSVGTVLFEMIAGCPPFNGENHIDLLRNIQRKAVRLPPDVRISKACVNLLRILLNRNPLSRAGFKEFFAACDTLVALGCNGTPTGGEDPDNEGGGTVGGFNNNNATTNNNRMATKDLGTIHENDHQFHHGSGGGGTTTTTASANNNMNPSSESLLTVATTMEQHQQQQQQQQHTNTSINAAICTNQQQQQQQQGNIYNKQHQLQPTTTSSIVSPNLTPSTAPIAAALIPNSINLYSPHHSSTSPQQQQQQQQPSYQQQHSTMMIRNRLSPLTSSPPSLGPIFHPPPSHHHDSRGVLPPQFPSSSHNMGTATTTTTNAGGTTQYPNVQQTWQQQQQQQQPSSVGYYNSVGSATPTGMVHANSVVSQSQASVNDDSGFVMVEHTGGASPHSSEHYYNVTASSQQQQQHHLQSIEQQQQQQQRRVSKGMLGTSPGTGKMLLGMVGRAATIGFGVGGGNNNNNNNSNSNNTAIASSLSSANQQHQFEQQRFVQLADAIAATNKMIATAEDVGRRAVSVAHLGDGRAYLGMRLTFKTNEEGSSLLSTSPMEGVEEEDEAGESGGGTTDGGSCSSTSADIRDFSTHNSSSTEIMAPSTRRRRSSSIVSDSNNSSNNKQMLVTEEPVEDEMPFAISPDAPSVSLPSRSNPSVYNRGSSMSRSMKKTSSMKANPQTIHSRFKEALSCYLKSLKMLKGAVGAAQRVTKDLTEIETQNMLLGQNNQTTIEYDIPKMKYRCEVTSNWLCSQFRGVLERADAANVEISKLDKQQEPGQEQEETANLVTTSVEELIYNHALASGRDGAVKHLLGQYEAARSCYRSAGLLAETLLMEVNIGPEDRKILEGYVDGFAARITELDQLMFQQSRMTLSSNTAPSSRRGSGIVGLIGPPPVAPTAFITGSPR